MEGSGLNITASDMSKSDCVTQQQTCTVPEYQYAPSVQSEEHSVDISSFSYELCLKQHEQENDGKGSSKSVEGPAHKDTLNVSASKLEIPASSHPAWLGQQLLGQTEIASLVPPADGPHTQSLEHSGTELTVVGKLSASSITGGCVNGNMPVKTIEKENNNNHCLFDLPKVTSTKLDQEDIGLVQMTGQTETDPAVFLSRAVVGHNMQQNSNAQQGTEVSVSEKGAADYQASNKEPKQSEARTGTGYLDGVISSMQSLSCKQPDADKDTVEISRAELTLMVEQTLAAQTMCTYMQDLVQKNKSLNRQNEVLKDSIMQTRNLECGGGECGGSPSSLSGLQQGAKGQVFCFPGTLPLVLEQEVPTSLFQRDGDMLSSSLQLPSNICVDGDHSLNREASAAGSHPNNLGASSSAVSRASLSAYGPMSQNIPDEMLLATANCYSHGPQQWEESSAGMSQEQVRMLQDELEKTKLFLHKLTEDGGIHPTNMQELVNLRGKVQSLQAENAKLMMELQNRPQKQFQNELEVKLQNQKKREHDLLRMIAELGKENKELKSKPFSQPSSSVGMQALPPIPTDELQSQLAKLSDQLKEAQSKEEESVKAVKSMRSELSAKDIKISQLQHTVTILREKEIKHVTEENEAYKRRLAQAEAEMVRMQHDLNSYWERYTQEAEKNRKEQDRNKQLEQMIGDERRRYARDEKELLDRVKMLSKQLETQRRMQYSGSSTAPTSTA